MKILLVQPPWGASYKPSIGLHLLQQFLLSRHDWEVDIAYSNLEFHDYLPDSFDSTHLINHFWDNPCLFWLSEGFFAPYAYYKHDLRDRITNGFLSEIHRVSQLPSEAQVYPQDIINWLCEHMDDVEEVIRRRIPIFLSHFTDSRRVKDADLIGFGCFYNQTCASLAMSRALRDTNITTPVVLGGPSVTEENSAVLLKYFEQIDYVIEGEGELPLERLCEKIEAMAEVEYLDDVTSLTYRNGDKGKIRNVQRDPRQQSEFVNLDDLPIIDYSAYFNALERSSFRHSLRTAPFETTRGCYWKQRSKCSFCGLADNFPYRMKSAENVCREIANLAERGNADYFVCTDATLPKAQMKRIIPRLIDYFTDRKQQPMFFFEVRADTTKEDISRFGKLGIVVLQAGIESFSTELLDLMRKGVDALTNVQFLKWCREEDICVFYNLLYGHPRENPDCYVEMKKIMQSIIHFEAPQGLMKVMLLRNSPLFREADHFKISDIRPWRQYNLLFPSLDDESKMQMSYYFDFDGNDCLDRDIAYQGELVEFVKRWQEWDLKNQPYLYHEIHEDGSVSVYDNRQFFLDNGEPLTLTLRDPILAQVLLSLDSISTLGEIKHNLHLRGYGYVGEEHIIDCLNRLKGHDLILEEDGHFLGLALPL